MIVRELLARFGIDFDAGGAKQANFAVEAMAGSFTKLAGVVAGGVLVNGIFDFVSGVVDMGDQLGRMSSALGVSAGDLFEWQTVLEQNELPAEEFSKILAKVSEQTIAASRGSKEAAKMFRDLGVQTKNADGSLRSVSDIFGDVVPAIATMSDETTRTAYSMKLLGERGLSLLPAFADGGDAVNALRQRIRQLTGGELESFVEQAQALDDSMDDWALTVKVVKTQIGAYLLPIAKQLFDAVASGVTYFQELAKGTRIVEVALAALGAVATVLAVQMILPWLPAILAVGALILVIEDLVGWFNGADSAIGDLIDSIWGVGASERAVEAVKQGFENMTRAVSDAWTWVVATATAIGEKLAAAWGYVAEVFGPVVGPIVDFLQELWGLVTSVASLVGGVLTTVWTTWGRMAKAALDAVLWPARQLAKLLGFDGLGDWAAQAADTAVRGGAALVGGTAVLARGAVQHARFGTDLAQGDYGQPASRMSRSAPAIAGPARMMTPASTRAVSVQGGPTSITVNGSGDPEAVASAVLSRMQERDEALYSSADEALSQELD
jgi:hypothetical protein